MVVRQDTFADVNGTLLENHVADTGETWRKSVGFLGTMSIQAARCQADAGVGKSYLWNAFCSEGEIEIDVDVQTGGRLTLNFRSDGAARKWSASIIEREGNITLEVFTSGYFPTFSQKAFLGATTSGTLKVTLSGSNIQVFWKGTLKIAVSSSSGQTDFLGGLEAGSLSGVAGTFDNLRFSGNAPTISSISPGSGLADSIVTINGLNLCDPISVTFDGIAASITSWNATEIICDVPGGVSLGVIPVVVNTVHGSVGTTFNVTALDVVVSTVSTAFLTHELNIIAGGRTIILNTVGGETWVATVGANNAITQALIDGLSSNRNDDNGWNNLIRPALSHTNVTRNSATMVTILLPAFPTYDISQDEIITAIIPATALVTAVTERVAQDNIQISAVPSGMCFQWIPDDANIITFGAQNNVAGAAQVAVSFEATCNGAFSSVRLWLEQSIAPPAGTFEVAIQNVDGGGGPDGTDLEEVVVNSEDIPAFLSGNKFGDLYEVKFSGSIDLVLGTVYAIVVRFPSPTNSIVWAESFSPSVDPNSELWISFDSGASWANSGGFENPIAQIITGEASDPIPPPLPNTDACPVIGSNELREFLSYISPDGIEYPFNTPHTFGRFVLNFSGYGTPPIDYVTQRAPFQHGVTVKDFFLRPRVIQLLIRENYRNRPEWWDGRAAILNQLRPNRQLTATGTTPGTLRLITANNDVRDLSVFIAEGPRFEPRVLGTWDEWAYQEVLRFIAHDPVLFDPALVTASFTVTVDANLVFPITFPIQFGNGVIDDTLNISYPGTWLALPTIVIAGRIDDPRIDNVTTGEKIELDLNIPNGRTVTIDLTEGVKTVTDDLGTNLIGAVSSDSDLATFHIAPDPEATGGINAMRLRGSNASGNTSVQIRYFVRYFGV